MTPDEPERLTDGTTTYWSRIFPTAWSVLMGVVVVLIWMDALGEGPAPDAVKVVATTLWGGLSALFFKMFGGLREVWLAGDDLLVGDPRRGARISLRDVREVKESRFTQVKTVTLKLSRPTPVGTSLTFIPKGAKTFFFPLSSSPVAEKLRERHREVLLPRGEAGPVPDGLRSRPSGRRAT